MARKRKITLDPVHPAPLGGGWDMNRVDPLLGGDMLHGGPYLASIDDPGLPFLVELLIRVERGRLACDRFTATRRPPRPGITSASLRIPLGDLMKATLKHHPGLIASRADGSFGAPTNEERDRAVRLSSADAMAQVVAAYREALADPLTRDRATQTVARRLGRSRGHVSKLLTAARNERLLRADERGRGGRGRKEER